MPNVLPDAFRPTLSPDDAALAAAHPHLLPRAQANGVSEHALVAKNIRALLKKEFPGVKFQVKADANHVNASVRVNWDAWPEAPTEAQVQALIQPFKAGSFNGMTDGYDYTEDLDLKAFHRVFGSVEYVRAGATRVSPSDVAAREAEMLRKEMSRLEKSAAVPKVSDRTRSRL